MGSRSKKRKKGLDLRCAIKSQQQRKKEMQKGIKTFGKDREDND